MTKPKFKICVTCVGGILIYDFIKALRDASDYEVEVLGVDADAAAHGRLLCDAFETVPRTDGDDDGARWIDSISRILQAHGVNGLICLSDREAALAATNHKSWTKLGIQTSVGPEKTAAVLTDKLRLMTALADGGLDTGRYRQVDSIEDAKEAVGELGYPEIPVVLKPRRESGSRGVLVCEPGASAFTWFLENRLCGAGRLEHVLQVAGENSIAFSDFIAVPYWAGPVYDVECLVQRGRVVETVARRRQLSNIFSPTSTGHIVDMNPVIVDFARDMCAILGVERAVDFDIVLRPDGKPAPFDASVRFSGSVGGGTFAGVNIISQLVRVMFDLPLAVFDIEDGVPLRPFRTLAAIPKNNADQLL